MIVLDTHVLLWLASDPSKLSAAAIGSIDFDPDPGFSAISVYEVGYLLARGRIGLDRPIRSWFADLARQHSLIPIPVSVEIAARAAAIDRAEFGGDPADRLIYATAVEHGSRLVSADGTLRDADPSRVVW